MEFLQLLLLVLNFKWFKSIFAEYVQIKLQIEVAQSDVIYLSLLLTSLFIYIFTNEQ